MAVHGVQGALRRLLDLSNDSKCGLAEELEKRHRELAVRLPQKLLHTAAVRLSILNARQRCSTVKALLGSPAQRRCSFMSRPTDTIHLSSRLWETITETRNCLHIGFPVCPRTAASAEDSSCKLSPDIVR